MAVKINEVELASELAHAATVDELVVNGMVYGSEDELFQSDGSDDEESTIYKEDVQNVFNGWYDYFYELIMNCQEN